MNCSFCADAADAAVASRDMAQRAGSVSAFMVLLESSPG